MFIAALFTIAKTWKQPKCPSTDDWIQKMCYIYTMEYYSAISAYFYKVLLEHSHVHSFVDGHLGCFHVLAIVSSATVNIGVHVSFLNESFVWIYAQEWDCWVIW